MKRLWSYLKLGMINVFHPDLPDLLVEFRTDLGRIDACYSERVGLVEIPARNARVPRSGEHTPESRLWLMGPDIPRGQCRL